MSMNRREFLVTATGSVALVSMGSFPAWAAEQSAEDKIKEFTGGVMPTEGGIDLGTPEIAENGNTVPVSVSIDSPMTEGDYIEKVMLLAAGNPNPDVVTFNFTPLSGEAAAKTRIRLAKTQDVIAVAKKSDGSFMMAKNQVKVTIGGCGG